MSQTDAGGVWRDFFRRWPADMAPRGVLVTSFNEQIGFSGFMIGEAALLIERQTPDSIGARTVMIPFANILALKFIDVIKHKSLEAAGFSGKIAPK